MISKVTTPADSERAIIRLRRQGKMASAIVEELNKLGYKTAHGQAWDDTSLRNQVSRLARNGIIKLRAGGKGAKPVKAKAKHTPVKTVVLKPSKQDKTETRYMTAMLRIPVSINMGTAEFRVMSLDK